MGGNKMCLVGEDAYNLCKLLNVFVPVKDGGNNCVYLTGLTE